MAKIDLLVKPDFLISPTWAAPIRRVDLRGDLSVQEFTQDFALRFAEAEAVKAAMRHAYIAGTRQLMPFGEMVKRAKSFWAKYEEVNQQFVPEDPVYSGTRAGLALSTSADLFTLSSPASGQVRILEVFISGEATASAVNRVALQTSTGGTTPTNQTPEKFNSRSPSAVSTFATTWSAQPSLSGNADIIQAFNAFGGADRWVPQPGEELFLVNGEIESYRSQSGTSTVSAYVIWEEL